MGAGPRIWTQINQGQFLGPFAHGWSVGGGKGSDANTTAHNVPLGTAPEP